MPPVGRDETANVLAEPGVAREADDHQSSRRVIQLQVRRGPTRRRQIQRGRLIGGKRELVPVVGKNRRKARASAASNEVVRAVVEVQEETTIPLWASIFDAHRGRGALFW